MGPDRSPAEGEAEAAEAAGVEAPLVHSQPVVREAAADTREHSREHVAAAGSAGVEEEEQVHDAVVLAGMRRGLAVRENDGTLEVVDHIG